MLLSLQDHDFIQSRAAFFGFDVFQIDVQYQFCVEAEIIRIAKQPCNPLLPSREEQQQTRCFDSLGPAEAQLYGFVSFVPIEIHFARIASSALVFYKVACLHCQWSAIAEENLLVFRQHENWHTCEAVRFGCDLFDINQRVITNVSTPPNPVIHDLVQANVAPIVIMIPRPFDFMCPTIISQPSFNIAVRNGGQPGEIMLEITKIYFSRAGPPWRDEAREGQIGTHAIHLSMNFITMQVSARPVWADADVASFLGRGKLIC